ncbi:MAG: hypothetical protein H6878_10910 [Rhodobiaceae bacterium]|nr:hypothetical protein [Rhodobiaceae bacterium]
MAMKTDRTDRIASAQAAMNAAGRRPGNGADASSAQPQTAGETAQASRSLVPVGVPAGTRSAAAQRDTRPSAAYLTQLIAGELGVEATRARRRAVPQAAVAAYVETRARAERFLPKRLVRSF